MVPFLLTPSFLISLNSFRFDFVKVALSGMVRRLLRHFGMLLDISGCSWIFRDAPGYFGMFLGHCGMLLGEF